MGCALMGLLNENWPLGLVLIFFFVFGFLEKVGKVGGCFGGYERIDPLSF